MPHEIRKYPVSNPQLRNYIRFFWGLKVEHIELDHHLIPQRNINLRFNLSGTSHTALFAGKEQLLEKVYFSGLHDRYPDIRLRMKGGVDVLGICFYPDGFYPFLGLPVSECRNQLLGAAEAGMKPIKTLYERLKETENSQARLSLLEEELLKLLDAEKEIPLNFRRIFHTLSQEENLLKLEDFCRQHSLGLRTLERMFSRYVGMPANTYQTLHRFQSSMNQLLYTGYEKLSDIAYSQNYFDQMHFIRDFKRFTGNTPKEFVNRNNSILQIGKMK